MQISRLNGTICIGYEDTVLADEKDAVLKIAQNTKNTWQSERKEEETLENTEQGKTAEKILECFLRQEMGQNVEFCTYDAIRCDNYKKHAPFDFLVWEKGKADREAIVKAIQKDILAATGDYVKISKATRSLCKSRNVKIVEVKSTKITDRHKTGAGFNGDYTNRQAVETLLKQIIQEDDFLCYPLYKRKETREHYSVEDYCREVKARCKVLAGFEGKKLQEKVIAFEKESQLSDLFVRVYLDEDACKGFLLGWIKKEDLYDETVCFKRMAQKGKSEYALYWAKSLTCLQKMDLLGQAVRED